jgi:invasion protein IalB
MMDKTMTIKLGKYLAAIALLAISGVKAQVTDGPSLWQLSCNNAEKCIITQQVIARRGNQSQVLAGATIAKNATNTILTIRVSAVANQQQGLGLKVDSHEAIRVPLQQCDRKVCESNIVLDSLLLQEMQSGDVLTVAFIDTNNKQVSLPLYLQGFKALLVKI